MTCSWCKKRFGGLHAFDMHFHLTGEIPEDAPVGSSSQYRRCRTARELIDIGMKRDKYGRWCRIPPVTAAMKEEVA